jgi:hypothetical protein
MIWFYNDDNLKELFLKYAIKLIFISKKISKKHWKFKRKSI